MNGNRFLLEEIYIPHTYDIFSFIQLCNVVANLHEFAISFQITVNYLQIGIQKEKKKTLGFTFQVNTGQY
jgi:hypothetical protein